MKKWIFIIIGVLVVGFGGYKIYAAKTNNTSQQSYLLFSRVIFGQIVYELHLLPISSLKIYG
jgi:type II secretory pathway component PulF